MIKKTIPCIFLLLISFISHAEIKSMSILYTNDLHSHLLPSIQTRISETRPVGGFANIATLVREKKLSDPDTIYIDSGDYFSGPYVSTLTNGAAVIESMNYLGLDVACIGNHEFDHGWENTLEQLNKASFPIVNGNIFYKNSDQLFWDNPYVILNKAGLKIGVIGLHGKFAFYDTINFKMIEAIETRDEVYYLKKYIAELKPITDIIILSVPAGVLLPPGRVHKLHVCTFGAAHQRADDFADAPAFKQNLIQPVDEGHVNIQFATFRLDQLQGVDALGQLAKGFRCLLQTHALGDTCA